VSNQSGPALCVSNSVVAGEASIPALATEPYVPEGRFGEWLSYGLVLVPLAWLVFGALRDRLRGLRKPLPARTA
jgi:hypothetical protein